MAVIDLLEKALNIRSLYQRVISTNLANVDTPGYRDKDIDFKKELEGQMTGSREIEVTTSRGDSVDPLLGNSVSIEDQMVKLNENSLYYSALVQMVSKKFSLMRYVINEGRR